MVMRRVEVAVIWLLIAGAATYLFVFDPAKGVGYPACPFRMLTGLQCPGCGSTRALHQLLHGHPAAAFELNPLLVILLPLIAIILLSITKSEFSGKDSPAIVLSPIYGWILFGVVVTFWIFRNTPFYPFVS
jgi:Protein of unknown function (DUF2752)